MMWEALAFGALMVASCLAGLWLGWTARDRAAVRSGDQSLKVVEPPLKEPIDLPMWTAIPKEDEEV